jgi:hypothetical protein
MFPTTKKNQRGQASLMVAWRFFWVSKSLRHPTRLLVVIAPKHCFRGEETLEADLHFESKRPAPFDPDPAVADGLQILKNLGIGI